MSELNIPTRKTECLDRTSEDELENACVKHFKKNDRIHGWDIP